MDISAFPKQPIMKMPGGVELVVEQNGMTLRDYFAAKAMQGFLLKKNEFNGVMGVNGYEYDLSYAAYKLADAMVKTRSLK